MDSSLKILLLAILLPVASVQLLIFVWRKMLYDEIPNLIGVDECTSFDYIIVGAGTAGSVVASELSRKSNATVLLIEAGHRFGVFSKVPLLATLAQKTENDWAFLSSPQVYSSKGLINQKQSLPRGKGLGGSSQLNYLLHFDGKKEDMEKWVQKFGIVDWSYDAIRPYLEQDSPDLIRQNLIENCKRLRINDCFCYANERKIPQNILQIPSNYSKITEALEKAKTEFADRFNFYRSLYNVKNGLRRNVYEEYLRPSFQQENLKILLGSIVKRVIIDNENNAKSVLVICKENGASKVVKIHAKKEIILSAGAFHTPQILQLSGIGSKSVLEDLGILPRINSPNVGRNLYDHMNMPIFVTINESVSLTVDKILNLKEMWKYFKTGEGHFSNFGVIGQITPKDDKFGVSIFAMGAIDEAALMSLSNFRQETFRSLFPLYYNSSQEGLVLLATCLQPSSRGFVKLKSKYIKDLPIVDPKYLSQQEDIGCMIKGIRSAVEIILSKSFRALRPEIHWPDFKECTEYGPFVQDFITNDPSDRYLECIIRTAALTTHHPGGTCSIGVDSSSVVDQYLRVNGVGNLRIVDASVIPTPISGTPNFVLIAMARRAVDIILKN